MANPDKTDNLLFAEVVETLERQRAEGLHDGAQAYVSRFGEPLLDLAIGESAPGRALERDDVMLWYSSGKPVTTTAVLQLGERGRLGLDDLVADYIAGWGAGKERVTVRHVLTHTGGFTMARRGEMFDKDVSYSEAVARIAAHPAEWEPGTKAGYHPTSGWKILGAIVEAVDGRPIDRYVRDEVLAPAGIKESRLGVPVEEQEALGDRLVPVHWKGHALALHDEGRLRMVPYPIEVIHNQPLPAGNGEPRRADGGLVLVLVTNGLPDPLRNEQRMFAFTDGVYSAFGDELAHLRRPTRSVSEVPGLST